MTKLSPNQVNFVQSTMESNQQLELRQRLWTLVSMFVVCVIGGFLLGTYVALKLNQSNDATKHSIDLNCTDHQQKFISRIDWLAQPPQEPLDPLKTPVSKVVIAHTATDHCTIEAACKFQVRSIQSFHIMSRGWFDIGYNFLVGGDGRVYIGRGWDKVGAHTKGYNHESICIAFLGTFTRDEPSQQQLCAAEKLLAQGIALGKLSNDYALYGHRQLARTTSPGDILYRIIQTWPHWRNDVRFENN